MKKLLSKISKRTQKIIIIIFSCILVILIITNPSNSRFKEYLNSQGLLGEKEAFDNFSYGRENNYFIFSNFKYINGEIHYNYIGIFGNFYEINKDEEYYRALGK